MTRERIYVTFEFQGDTVLIPAMFEGSARTLAAPNAPMRLLEELAPPAIVDRLTIADMTEFFEAWSKASTDARPAAEVPVQPRRIYPIVWVIMCAIVAVGYLTLTILSYLGVETIGDANRAWIGGMIVGYVLVSWLAPPPSRRAQR